MQPEVESYSPQELQWATLTHENYQRDVKCAKTHGSGYARYINTIIGQIIHDCKSDCKIHVETNMNSRNNNLIHNTGMNQNQARAIASNDKPKLNVNDNERRQLI